MEKIKMSSPTYSMKRNIIPYWTYSKLLLSTNRLYPHRMTDVAKSFALNQIQSKSWLAEHLSMFSYDKNNDIWILGSWYGNVIVPLLNHYLKDCNIHLVDYDKEAIELSNVYCHKHLGLRNITYNHKDVNFDLQDLEADIIINTSCEHMLPMKDFNHKGLCAYQSNNYRKDSSHINCVDSIEEFIEQCDFKKVLYSGEKQFHEYDDEYKRFMIIGER